MSILRYKGILRNGTAVTGAIDSVDLARWVQAKYELAGWRSLTVRRDGEVVAEIFRHPDNLDEVLVGGKLGHDSAHHVRRQVIQDGIDFNIECGWCGYTERNVSMTPEGARQATDAHEQVCTGEDY